jgi:CRISPR-associated endonuclease/helicase Cas3
VISTQLIEAGVDIDFPIVFRSAAGMDSIAQAAGRCNREGIRTRGKVIIFKMESAVPPGYFRQTMQCAERLFEEYPTQLLEPQCIREYFLDYYWMNQQHMDSDDIVVRCNEGSRGDIQFKDISEFQMIKTATVPIIIAIDEIANSLVNQLAYQEHCGPILRKLQQYAVQVYPYHLDEISTWLENPKPGVFILRSSELYSEKTGLMHKSLEGEAFFA